MGKHVEERCPVCRMSGGKHKMQCPNRELPRYRDPARTPKHRAVVTR